VIFKKIYSDSTCLSDGALDFCRRAGSFVVHVLQGIWSLVVIYKLMIMMIFATFLLALARVTLFSDLDLSSFSLQRICIENMDFPETSLSKKLSQKQLVCLPTRFTL
jgi:hypothetical protein